MRVPPRSIVEKIANRAIAFGDASESWTPDDTYAAARSLKIPRYQSWNEAKTRKITREVRALIAESEARVERGVRAIEANASARVVAPTLATGKLTLVVLTEIDDRDRDDLVTYTFPGHLSDEDATRRVAELMAEGREDSDEEELEDMFTVAVSRLIVTIEVTQ